MKNRYFGILAALLCLTACAPKDSEEFGIKTQVVAYDKLPIKRDGLKVIKMNDRLRVVVNTSKVFKGFSAKFRYNYLATLMPLSDIIKTNKQIRNIEVHGYQTSIGNDSRITELSHKQADAIAAYLWALGIDSQRIKVFAHGSNNMVSDPSTASGNIENRRINVDIF